MRLYLVPDDGSAMRKIYPKESKSLTEISKLMLNSFLKLEYGACGTMVSEVLSSTVLSLERNMSPCAWQANDAHSMSTDMTETHLTINADYLDITS